VGAAAAAATCLGDFVFGRGLGLQNSSSSICITRFAATGVDDAKVAGVSGVSSTMRSGSREEEEAEAEAEDGSEDKDFNGFCTRRKKKKEETKKMKKKKRRRKKKEFLKEEKGGEWWRHPCSPWCLVSGERKAQGTPERMRAMGLPSQDFQILFRYRSPLLFLLP